MYTSQSQVHGLHACKEICENLNKKLSSHHCWKAETAEKGTLLMELWFYFRFVVNDFPSAF